MVNDAGGMSRRERLGNLRPDLADLGEIQRTCRQAIRERRPVDELHDDEEQPVGLFNRVDRNDRRMAQRRCRARFPQ